MATQTQDFQTMDEQISPEDQAKLAHEIASEKVPEKTPSVSLEAIADATVMRELERLKVEEGRFEFQQRRAKLFAMSGLFSQKNITGAMAIAQAMVKIELGESMGFSPAESLQGIYVINGVTSVASALRAARMQAAGYDWRIDWLGTEEECTGCRLWLYRDRKPVTKPLTDAKGTFVKNEKGEPVMVQVSEAFTKADALRMKTTIWEDNKKRRCSILEKENWQMSPRNMYFARAVTNLQRFHAPSVLNINIASREELEDMADPKQQLEDEVMRASITLDQVKPSTDQNRGHDATQPEKNGNGDKGKGGKPNLKFLGPKNHIPVYSELPDKNTISDGQKLYVRDTSGHDTLYTFAAEEKDADGSDGVFLMTLA